MKNICRYFVLLSLGSSPASAEEYYVVRDVLSNKCKVVDNPPTTTELVLIRNGTVYFERNEAERSLASAVECTSPGPKEASSVSNVRKVQTDAPRAKPKRQIAAAKKLPNQALANSHPVVQRQDPIASIFTLFR